MSSSASRHVAWMCSLILIISSRAVVALSPDFVQSGKPYPVFPTEFATTMIQNKFNSNGFLVNHTCAGIYYSSFSRMKIRSDCTGFPLAMKTVSRNNASLASQFGLIEISIIDFTKSPPLNTLFQKKSISDPGSCTYYNASWLPPFSSNFLNETNAVFQGTYPDPFSRQRNVDHWGFTMMATNFVFYFDAVFQHPVGYQFSNQGTSQDAQRDVNVQTQFVNLWGTDDPTLFDDALFDGVCP